MPWYCGLGPLAKEPSGREVSEKNERRPVRICSGVAAAKDGINEEKNSRKVQRQWIDFLIVTKDFNFYTAMGGWGQIYFEDFRGGIEFSGDAER